MYTFSKLCFFKHSKDFTKESILLKEIQAETFIYLYRPFIGSRFMRAETAAIRHLNIYKRHPMAAISASMYLDPTQGLYKYMKVSARISLSEMLSFVKSFECL